MRRPVCGVDAHLHPRAIGPTYTQSVRESEVEGAFVAHLRERGWDVTTENADYADVIARRGVERIVAEVKGNTSSVGTDVDTLYGQLLRRMGGREEGTRYAVVVPAPLATAATRVPEAVRALLDIDVWIVGGDGSVAVHAGE